MDAEALVSAADLEQPQGRALYDVDEHLWIDAQIAALRENIERLDRATLIEYLGEMTIRDRRELQSRLTVLLTHLLKVQHQPERLTMSWVRTILEQQREIRSILAGIPSLVRHADAVAAIAYPDAVRAAARETRIPVGKFPPHSSWSVRQALDFDPPDVPVKSDHKKK